MELGHEEFMKHLPNMASLSGNMEDPLAEPTEEDYKRLGMLQLCSIDGQGVSLVGMARENIVDSALSWGADYLLWWDDDMLFPFSTFLRLWRHQKPVISALAFAARSPVWPVIHRIRNRKEPRTGEKQYFSERVLDYPKNKLISDEDIGGALGVGASTMLMDMRVFRQIERPWFHSTGCGEDYFFCVRCHEHSVRIYLDTSLKNRHLKYDPEWIDEDYYEKYKAAHPEEYEGMKFTSAFEMTEEGLKNPALAVIDE